MKQQEHEAREIEARELHRELTGFLSLLHEVSRGQGSGSLRGASASDARGSDQVLARYRAALPLKLRRLVEDELLHDLDWRKEALKAPHRFQRWRTIRRYTRRTQKSG